MAKFGQIEISKDDIKAFGDVLNSKIGLAALVCGMGIYALWVTVPLLSDIKQNTGLTAQSLLETKHVAESNHEILVRMMDRCEQKPASKNETASINQGVALAR